MENKRKALGKGLEQLFSNEVIDFDNFEKKIVNETKDSDIVEIPLTEIRSNPYQPRKEFDEQSLREFADSIKEHGVIQPIIVKKSIKGYEIIAGERRTRASKMAGKETIPAIIRDFTDQEMMEIALIENIQREDLNPIEEAEALAKIIESNNMTQEEAAKKFGKSRSYITNILGLLSLPEKTKKYVREGKISMGHARVLSKLSDTDQINKLADLIIEEGLSVRETEKLTSAEDMPKKNKIKREPVYNARHTIYETIMRERIGTKVKIGTKKIEIPYASDNDLDRILDILGISMDGE
ncbi:MAG: ParB/RepB/Spo0J family partition protein [Firmicutes bacterium]|nr:ParB/RepB/Spo0J family partition protein [Bacillota bacterium]